MRSAFLDAGTPLEAPRYLRASGIYKQDRGEWRLVQLHLSRPFVAPDTTRADSAAMVIALVFWLIAVGGHANSASPSSLAVTSDALHLLAAAAWVGGIAQIALCWLPRLRQPRASGSSSGLP